jgi:hypothetical protein
VPGSTPVENVIRAIPFKVQDLVCRKDGEGLACQVGIGDGTRTNVRLRDEGIDDMKCTEAKDGTLVCHVILSGTHEQVDVAFPKGTIPT